VRREEFVASAHEQHGVNGWVGDEGRLSDSGDDEIAEVALDERMGDFGSEITWGHGCER
jgi:hypothetical protein